MRHICNNKTKRMKKSFLPIAAAVVLTIAVATFYSIKKEKDKPFYYSKQNIHLEQNIMPGLPLLLNMR